jgi:4'-phosphopantetheinyl transferase
MTPKPQMASLGPKEVHIHLLRTKEAFAGLSVLLPAEDQAQISRFGLESRRREFLWSRLLLRRLAAFYLKNPPSELQFGFRGGGKPILEKSRLRFNLSHTQGLVACCFSWREVGLDIERIDLTPSAVRRGALLAERYFSREEVDFIRAQPPESQGSVYFQLFTMKEATVKALGRGLGLSFKRFSVPLPLLEISRSGPWEYFIPTLEKAGYCLAQVTKNTQNTPCRYQIYDWDQESFIPLLQKNVFATARQ